MADTDVVDHAKDLPNESSAEVVTAIAGAHEETASNKEAASCADTGSSASAAPPSHAATKDQAPSHAATKDQAPSDAATEDQAPEKAQAPASSPAAGKKDPKKQKQQQPWVLPDPKTEEELREAIAAIKGNKNLPRPPYPKLPKMDSKTSAKKRIRQIQKYISALQYNHTGKRYFSVRKDRGMFKLTDTAKKIMTNSLPIQCLEAVFLASYLTADLRDVERIPISFKSSVSGFKRNFRHIVMAVRHNGKWGALGLSRKSTLMYKEMNLNSLSELIRDYQKSYEGAWHTLVKIYVGFPFSHDVFSAEPIKWRVLRLRVDTHPWDMVAPVIDTFAKNMKTLRNHYTAAGRLPASFKARLKFRDGGTKDQDSSGNEDDTPAKSKASKAGSPHPSGTGRPKLKPKVPRTSPKKKKKKSKDSAGNNSAQQSQEAKAASTRVEEQQDEAEPDAATQKQVDSEEEDDFDANLSLRSLDHPDSEFYEDSGTDVEGGMHEDSDAHDGLDTPSLHVTESQIQHSFLGV